MADKFITINGSGEKAEIEATVTSTGSSEAGDIVGLDSSGQFDYSVIPGTLDGEPNGFIDRTEVTLSWDDATRTATLTPVGADFSIYSNGTKYTFSSAESYQIPDTEGEFYIYFDETGTLTHSTTFLPAIIEVYCFIVFVYWDATNSEVVPDAIVEWHGSSMDPATHEYIHNTIGTVYDTGLTTAVTANGDGDVDSSAQFTLTAGVIWDEDIRHSQDAKSLVTDNTRLIWRDGASGLWRGSTTTFLTETTGTGRAAYNEWTGATWQLTMVSNNDFVLAHIFSTPGVTYSHTVVMGQAVYTTLNAARSGAEVELINLSTGALPFTEFVAVATVIMQTSNGYDNSVKSRVRTTADGDDYIDWRLNTPQGVGSSGSDHNVLSNLQGGAGGEYYHLTLAEYGDLNETLVSANDTTPGFLNGKLIPEETLALTENNDGGDETLTIGFSTDTAALMKMADGVFLDHASVSVTSNGTVITLALEKDGTGDLRIKFMDGYYLWDTTPAATISLTAGTDTVPVSNYVYLLQSTKVFTVSTVGFPSGAQYAPVAVVLCQSASSLQTDGALKVHVWCDHSGADNNGHLLHVNEWIRAQSPQWLSGIAASFSGDGTATIGLSLTSGVVLQMHEDTFPAVSDPAVIYCVNDPDTPYRRITNIADLLKDSTGASLNNSTYALVFWGSASENSGDCTIFCNLPSDSESTGKQTLVREDTGKVIDYSIPEEFRGTGFLIYRLIIENTSSLTWALDTGGSGDDLRGQLPNLGAGSSTAIGTEFPDSTFRVEDDTDISKKLAFELSGVTTATTRTLTVPDASGTIALTSDLTNKPTVFVQDADPVASAVDGDIWIEI